MLKALKSGMPQHPKLLNLALGLRLVLERLFEKAWPSYVLIAILQSKVLWGIWRFRDFSNGDTAGYFVIAYRWYEAFADLFIWSPLYTSFYGTLVIWMQDAYAATIFHRAMIVMAATLGILAIMRKLLPPALALLVAIWWAILPI